MDRQKSETRRSSYRLIVLTVSRRKLLKENQNPMGSRHKGGSTANKATSEHPCGVEVCTEMQPGSILGRLYRKGHSF